MIDKHKAAIDAFGAFISGFMRDLDDLSEEGWSILVEGQRDETALRKLGFRGGVITISSVKRRRAGVNASSKVVILTDLDREGAVLAARYLKFFRQEGIRTSLAERRRLKHASRGLFLHIENLSRFEDGSWDGLPSPTAR